MNVTTINKRPSLRMQLLSIAPWILGGITALVLFTNTPSQETINVHTTTLLLCVILTVFALLFAVLLSEGELSPAHMVGMLSLLSLPAEVMPATTWAVFIGGVCGILLRPILNISPRHRLVTFRARLFVIIRVTLSFWAAGHVYISAGGITPLARLPENFSLVALPLVIYGLVYITLYFSIFLLEIYSDGLHIVQLIRTDLARIAVILILPIPFALLGAEILSQLSIPSQTIFIAGLVLIILALYALSLSEYRLRRQLDELRTLSVVSQAMRSHLNLDALLRTIYVQIAQLLNIDSFSVGLYGQDEDRLHFPLIMRQGKEATLPVDGREIQAVFEHVSKTARPLLIEENVAETSREIGAQITDPEIVSWLGVPLLAGGRILGVMTVASYDPRRKFTRDDQRLLNIIAANSSIAIENAQLYDLQTERAEQLVTLNRVATLLTGTLSPDKVLDTVISSASTISTATAVAVYLFWDDAKTSLPLVRSAGLSDAFILNAPDTVTFQQSASQSLALIVVNDVRTDDRVGFLQKVLLDEKKFSLVELPLEVGEDTLGVLAFYYDQPQSFTSDKIEILKTFANQASQAINNARKYTVTDEAFQRSVEQLLTLANIGRLLTSTIDLKNICDLMLSQVTDLTEVNAGMVFLLNEVTGEFEVVSHHGYPGNTLDDKISLQNGVQRRVITSGQIQRLDDVRRDPDYISLLPSTISQLCVPILRGRDVLGVITLESDRVAGFSEEDSYFVSQVANQAVIAIDNARLFVRISEARDRLRVLLDAMEEGIILIDDRGRIALANPRIDLIGLRQSELMAKDLRELVDDSGLNFVERAGFVSPEDAQNLLDGVNDGRNYAPVNYVVLGERGALHIRRQIVPVKDNEGRIIGILLVFYNKTEEEELARSREDISRMIVHDLRSPLTAVTTSLKLVNDLVPKDASFYPSVYSVTDASRRAIRKVLSLVDSLLDIAKMESGQLSIDADLTDLRVLVDNVCAELDPLAHELEITIKNDIRADLSLLDIDPDKIERLILNLVDNALKYTSQGSDITVSSRLPGQDGAEVGFVRIDVADRGPGVPSEYKNSLFDRFVQIEGRRKVRRGVGLGLTFCRLVTEAHGGRIWIEDNPGGGTIFAFTLPLAKMGRVLEE